MNDGHVVVEFCSQEEPGDWVEEDEGPGHLAVLLPLRAELAVGDHRALYLGWLLCLQTGDVDDADEEPPCPPGLRTLSVPLEAMIDFFHIDRDLLAAAATGSPDEREPRASDIERWASSLTQAKRTVLLVRLVEGRDPHLRADLLREVRLASDGLHPAGAALPRTAGHLLAEVDRRQGVRARLQAERADRERAEREDEAAKGRSRELDALQRREPLAWAEVDAHVATKLPKRYEQAAKLLRDLRDLALRRGDVAAVDARIEQLCAEHVRKASFVRRVRSAIARPA